MKQLLAVCWEMPPLSGPRAVQVTRLLTALGSYGWRSRVVCFAPQSNRYQQDYHIDVERDSGGVVTRVPVRSPEEWLAIRALWRIVPPLKHVPDEKIVWFPAALSETRRLLSEQPAHVIVSFAQPWTDHLVGLHAHRESRIPLVAHFSDPWTDSPYQRDGSFSGVRRRMEAAVIGEANATVFVNCPTRDRVMQKYSAALAARSHVIPQGHDSVSSRPATIGPLRVIYTGRFYDGIRTPATLIAAVESLQRSRPREDELVVELIGSGMEAYAEDVRRRGLDRVIQFAGRHSPHQTKARAEAADVLLVIDAPSEGPSLFLPSKLIDYLPLQRVIIGVTPAQGPSAELIQRLGYPVVDPGDSERLAAVLADLIAQKRSGPLPLSPQHDRVAAEYSITPAAKAMDRVLNGVMRADS